MLTITAKSSKKNERRQVNEKFHKLERGLQGLHNKDKRQDKDIQLVYRIMHQALDDIASFPGRFVGGGKTAWY